MVVKTGEKLHVMYRSLHEKSTRRHFVGVVIAATNSLCRIEGFVFIYDEKKTEFIRKPECRTTIIDLAESGYIVNIIGADVELEAVRYKHIQGVGLVATDGKSFTLDINEFGGKG